MGEGYCQEWVNKTQGTVRYAMKGHWDDGREGAEVPEVSGGSGISNVLRSKATRTPESVMHPLDTLGRVDNHGDCYWDSWALHSYMLAGRGADHSFSLF